MAEHSDPEMSEVAGGNLLTKYQNWMKNHIRTSCKLCSDENCCQFEAPILKLSSFCRQNLVQVSKHQMHLKAIGTDFHPFSSSSLLKFMTFYLNIRQKLSKSFHMNMPSVQLSLLERICKICVASDVNVKEATPTLA